MSDGRIADILNIEGRFLRSAHLERDFYDSTALVRLCRYGLCAVVSCRRIGEGLKPDSGQRAWRITGHYGAGKSSFALLLAHLLAGRESNLPPQIRSVTELGQQAAVVPTVLGHVCTAAIICLDPKSPSSGGSKVYGRGTKVKLAAEIKRLCRVRLRTNG